MVRGISEAINESDPKAVKVPSGASRSVDFRKGIVGDWANCFSKDDLNLFLNKAAHVFEVLGYK